jgi:hypothetical protein
MKKAKPDEMDIEQIDIERAAKLLETAASAPLHTETRQRRRKRKQPKTEKSSIRDRIEKEIKLYETEQDVRRFGTYILEPPPDLSWTKDLPDYEEARLSAENAMRKIFASTDAAHIGFEAGIQNPFF